MIIEIDFSDKDFRHLEHLKAWIERNKGSARDRLLKYEAKVAKATIGDPANYDQIAGSRNIKLCAAAESALIQWGVYAELVKKMLANKPRPPELFDAIEDKEKSQEVNKKEGEKSQEVNKKEGEKSTAQATQEDPAGEVQRDADGDPPAVAGDGEESGTGPGGGHDQAATDQTGGRRGPGNVPVQLAGDAGTCDVGTAD
ncbi:MAG: hypothetical protein K8963_09235 [Proteobacteria bacterium]|nr:hypothetical protein [Pseudomonadota bacterium]